MTGLAAVAGALVGLGVVALVCGVRGVPVDGRRWDWRRALRRGQHAIVRSCLALLAGALVGAVTRWPVAALATAVLSLLMPRLLGSRRAHADRLARLGAVAAWAEMLRDTLTAGLGIETAIRASAATAPLPIRPEVELLAAELRGSELLDGVLRRFCARVDNPTCDRVVAALLLPRGSSSLSQRLSAIAESANQDVDMRRRVDAEREGSRWTARLIVVITAAMALGLAVLNRAYLEPYDSGAGQLVLVVVVLIFATGYAWLGRITAEPAAVRLLVGTDPAP